MTSIGLMLAVGLALVHGFISRLEVDAWMPEYRWISFTGGISMAYIFLEVLPELSQAQTEFAASFPQILGHLEHHTYLMALLGLTVFYGLDRLVLTSRQLNRTHHDRDRASTRVFWIHMAAFASLNLIFGYLLQDLSEHSLIECMVFFIAVALHFFIMDHGLREHHKALYDQRGRWWLTGAILIGAIAELFIHLDEAIVALVWAFLAGSIILNILKRELPEAQKTCFWSFLTGATLYSGLLLLI
ncbi:MAG: hypothetical protein EA342_16955 [Leptolyngbya sp. LCM1.Bin17]|nr:MAG: hypothetical protein EA342_16955 [Leptolyngbya sp. LCM1.Bin17]